MTTFAEIIDPASSLSADGRKALLEIIGRRLAEQNRSQIVKDVVAGRAEFTKGIAVPSLCQPDHDGGFWWSVS